MTPPKIETPRGSIVIGPNGKAELKFNTNFQPKWQKRYSEAQKFVDSEVLRLCNPLTPFRTGMLIKSGILGTEIGSGTVSWIAPYARRQYYTKRKHPSADPNRGPYWFERMKAQWKQYLISGAKMIAGRDKK